MTPDELWLTRWNTLKNVLAEEIAQDNDDPAHFALMSIQRAMENIEQLTGDEKKWLTGSHLQLCLELS